MAKPVRPDEEELADAILAGARRRRHRPDGGGVDSGDAWDVLGSAIEQIHVSSDDATEIYQFFAYLAETVRVCPHESCRRPFPFDSLLWHLHAEHVWGRERIAAWLAIQLEADRN